MVTMSDWETAYREVIERSRARLGDPPTPEELIAWSRGELPESEAERIRELLACYPDLAAALAGDSEAFEDEAPVLSREQLAMDWELLQQRMAPSVAPHVVASQAAKQPGGWRRWSTPVPVLATFLLVGLFVYLLSTINTLRKERNGPRENVERLVLLENRTRGGPPSPSPVTLQPTTKYIVLALTVAADVRTDRLRVELRDLDANPPKVVWKSVITRGGDGTFSFEVPRSFLMSQTYGVNLYAETGAGPVASYAFWLSKN